MPDPLPTPADVESRRELAALRELNARMVAAWPSGMVWLSHKGKWCCVHRDRIASFATKGEAVECVMGMNAKEIA